MYTHMMHTVVQRGQNTIWYGVIYKVSDMHYVMGHGISGEMFLTKTGINILFRAIPLTDNRKSEIVNH